MNKAPAFGASSAVLFFFGTLLSILYVSDRATGGGGPIGFLESACALFAGAWLAGLLHVRRAGKNRL